MADRKTSFRSYSAWNYEKEIEELNRASAEGWQLIKGGCFHSNFEKNDAVQYRYQLDYGKIDNMSRYIESFREQGWEYVNSTFNGWHYFRKIYDPALPEEAYEIYTDRQSLKEMNDRWANMALVIAILLSIFTVMEAVFMIRQPQLPTLALLLTVAIEAAVLWRGVYIMKRSDAGKNSEGSAFMTVFLAVIVIGLASLITLKVLRVNWTTMQSASGSDAPEGDSDWLDFDVKYKDNYYLDLDIDAAEPATVRIVNEAGEEVFTKTADKFSEENIPLKLAKGNYALKLSHGTGNFEVKCELD